MPVHKASERTDLHQHPKVSQASREISRYEETKPLHAPAQLMADNTTQATQKSHFFKIEDTTRQASKALAAYETVEQVGELPHLGDANVIGLDLYV